MGKLPYEGTDVPVRRSQMEVQDLLQAVGFENVALVIEGDCKRIVANTMGGVTLRFEVDVDAIVEKMVADMSSKSRIKYRENPEGSEFLTMRARAERAGWRYLHYHVKHVCDGIRLGLTEIAGGFAGYLLVTGPDGQSETLANRLAAAANAGELRGPGMGAALGLPAPKGVK